MVKGRGMGSFGAAPWLEQPRQSVAGRSVSRPLPWESRTSQIRLTHPEQPQGPSSGTARG